MFNTLNIKPQVLATLPANQFLWGEKSVLVWIPSSEGNLRYVYGYDSKSDPREFLLLKNIPLIKVHANECPTCPQLLQAGHGIDKIDSTIVERIEYYQNLCCIDESKIIDSLEPLLMLLEKGLYMITNINYYPTDGQGNSFWTIDNNPKLCEGLSVSFEAQERPSFLIPTQAIGRIDYDRVEYYRDKVRSGEKVGGIAYYIGGYMSALLDGHHRAMASLLEHKLINCLTISRVQAISQEGYSRKIKAFLACGTWIEASLLPKHIRKKIEEDFNKIEKIDTSEVESYLEMQSQEWKQIENSKEVADAARQFPRIKDIKSISLAGELMDDGIDLCLEGNDFNGEDKEKMGHILNALIALNDNRAYNVALRIASSDRWISLWEDAFLYLTRFKNAEIEDFFVNFLVNDEENRTHIKKIIDDYFEEL